MNFLQSRTDEKPLMNEAMKIMVAFSNSGLLSFLCQHSHLGLLTLDSRMGRSTLHASFWDTGLLVFLADLLCIEMVENKAIEIAVEMGKNSSRSLYKSLCRFFGNLCKHGWYLFGGALWSCF